jgi:energy-coupling factor transporter ATP-binding protein EcfA2
MSHSQQVQRFGDISVGDGSTFTINQILQISTSVVQTRPLNRASPYRGLKRFEVADRDLFFGRDQLIYQLIQSISQRSLTLLLGASGSGKSSVMRAGVIPQLAEQLRAQFQCLVFTPDRDPFESLRMGLLALDYKQAQTEFVLSRQSDTLVKVLHHLKPEACQWLIFVDQFEELFTLCQLTSQRKAFIDSLMAVVELSDPSVKVALAMRADFLDRFGPYPTLSHLVQQNVHLITDMHPDELRLAIEQPAAAHGVVFEATLVDEVIRDLEGQAGSLPLLQYTLDLLWQRSDLESRTLRTKNYRGLGGVRGALQQRVEDIYGSLDERDRNVVKQIFFTPGRYHGSC